jgi:hypothetical protein
MAFSKSPRWIDSFAPCARESGSSAPVMRTSARGYSLVRMLTAGIEPPTPMQTAGTPHVSSIAASMVVAAGEDASPAKPSVRPAGVKVTSAPNGVCFSTCRRTASIAAAVSVDGARLRLNLARATGCSVSEERATEGTSMPITASAGLVHSRDVRDPDPTSGTPGRTPESARNSSSDSNGPGVSEDSSPSTATLPSS